MYSANRTPLVIFDDDPSTVRKDKSISSNSIIDLSNESAGPWATTFQHQQQFVPHRITNHFRNSKSSQDLLILLDDENEKNQPKTDTIHTSTAFGRKRQRSWTDPYSRPVPALFDMYDDEEDDFLWKVHDTSKLKHDNNNDVILVGLDAQNTNDLKMPAVPQPLQSKTGTRIANPKDGISNPISPRNIPRNQNGVIVLTDETDNNLLEVVDITATANHASTPYSPLRIQTATTATKYFYDYSSKASLSNAFIQSPKYKSESIHKLMEDFPLLRKDVVEKLLHLHNHYGAYCFSFEMIWNCLKNEGEEEYQKMKKVHPKNSTLHESEEKQWKEEHVLSFVCDFLKGEVRGKNYNGFVTRLVAVMASSSSSSSSNSARTTTSFPKKIPILLASPRHHRKDSFLLTSSFPSSTSIILPSPSSSTTAAYSSNVIDVHNQCNISISDPNLKDEVRYIQNQWKEWKDTIENKKHLRNLRSLSEQIGNTFECQCCFAQVAFEEMVSCKEEGHLFCMDCIRRHVEERVFGLGNFGIKNDTADIICMHLDGCTSGFPYLQLERALPPKILQKYNELQSSIAVETAGIQNLCKCPKCDFQALLPETETIFRCPVSDCGFESCSKCGEEKHFPLRCEEVEKRHDTNARLTVEEAMTEARVRSCPKCGKKFYKQDGCNKMTCSCRSLICYVCRQLIPPNVGYKHFCQVPHCTHVSCKQCPLYSKDQKDEMNAVRVAGIKAVETIVQSVATKEHSIAVKINVDDILKDPSKKASTKLPHQGIMRHR